MLSEVSETELAFDEACEARDRSAPLGDRYPVDVPEGPAIAGVGSVNCIDCDQFEGSVGAINGGTGAA